MLYAVRADRWAAGPGPTTIHEGNSGGDASDIGRKKFEIVQAIFDDDTELAIAQRLGISQHTVHTHIERLYQKLDVGSRIQLVMCVVRQYVSERSDLEPLSLEWPTPQ